MSLSLRHDLLKTNPDGQRLTLIEGLWSLSGPVLFVASIPVVFVSTDAAHALWGVTALVPIAVHLHAKRLRRRRFAS